MRLEAGTSAGRRRKPRSFRRDIEGLRGLAVVAVVLYHAGLGSVRGGYVGVDVFFVISGFLITGLLWDEIDRSGRLAFGAFYARRARRLLPAAAVVLVVTVVASAAILPPLRARGVMEDAQTAALYVSNYRFALQQTNYLAPHTVSPLQHYWSLGVEEQFYLLWPVLLVSGAAWLSMRARVSSRTAVIVVLAAIAMVSFVWCRHLTAVSQPWAFFALWTRAWEFAAGAAVAMAQPVIARVPRRAAALVGWLGFGAVVWSMWEFTSRTAFPGTAGIVPVGGAALLIAAGCAAPARGASLVLSSSPLRSAGRISYTWYLWHWPVLVLVPIAVGHSLGWFGELVLVGFSGLLAWTTTVLVERPVRSASFLTTRRSLVMAVSATALVLGAVAITAAGLGPLRGKAPAAAPPALRIGTEVPTSAPHLRGAALVEAQMHVQLVGVDAPVVRAVAQAATHIAVPSNLEPSLAAAHDDEAAPFVDGCDASFTVSTPRRCWFGATGSSREIVLMGDSHASQYFPAVDAIANRRDWKLVVLAKATCPPVEIDDIYSPVLGRTFTECTQFRQAALARIRADHPLVVILGIARHYGPEYNFRVYGQQWNTGLAATVREIRAMGTRVIVMGPTPKPNFADVPDCLSAHLDDANACATPAGVAVNSVGLAAERAAVIAAGASYVDVRPWLCTATVCPVVVGNLLVYKDDNHLTTTYVSWLTPAFVAAFDDAMTIRRPEFISPF